MRVRRKHAAGGNLTREACRHTKMENGGRPVPGTARPEPKPVRYRTGFISDLHLGARGSSSKALLEFLKVAEFDKLFVVGDFIDLWQLRKTHHWPQDHNEVLQKLLRLGRKDVPIIYIPGNHDIFVLNFVGTYGNVTVKENDIHVTADGKRLLVMHGHEFDAVTMNAVWLSHLGDMGYNFLLRVNVVVNFFRRVLGHGHWSLSAWVKSKVKGAVNRISTYEDSVARYARMHDATGIICGHIHIPAVREIQGIQYYNTGDWVESCTALVEHYDGRMELIFWRERESNYAREAAQAAGAAEAVVA